MSSGNSGIADKSREEIPRDSPMKRKRAVYLKTIINWRESIQSRKFAYLHFAHL